MSLVIPSFNSTVAFYIFKYPVKYYGLCISLAIFCGLFLSYFLMKKKFDKIIVENFIDNSPFIILFSILGARLFYVIGDYKFYLNNLNEIFLINHGGISIYGAILFGIIYLVFYCKKKRISFWNLSDCLAVTMPLSQSIGRWGNYFNQEAFGIPANGFIKLFVDYQYRPFEFKTISYYHPTFLYESVLDFILFLVLLLFFLKFK